MNTTEVGRKNSRVERSVGAQASSDLIQRSAFGAAEIDFVRRTKCNEPATSAQLIEWTSGGCSRLVNREERVRRGRREERLSLLPKLEILFGVLAFDVQAVSSSLCRPEIVRAVATATRAHQFHQQRARTF